MLTSDQDDEFAPDVLDTMKFMASLVANYVSSYNRCVWEHVNAQDRSDASQAALAGSSPLEGEPSSTAVST